MDKPWKVICAFVGVFIAGAVFGGFFTLRTSSRRLTQELELARQATVTLPVVPPSAVPPPAAALVEPPPAPALPPGPNAVPLRNPISIQLMRQFAQRLTLTNDQREKVRPIFARWGEDFQHQRQENERQQQKNLADTLRLSERMYREVGELLTAEQRLELEKMRRETEERVEREKQKRLEAQTKNKANKSPAEPIRPQGRADKGKVKSDPGP